jgi:hypothetical protein
MEARYRRKAWPRLRYSEAAERYSEAPDWHAGASEYLGSSHATGLASLYRTIPAPPEFRPASVRLCGRDGGR